MFNDAGSSSSFFPYWIVKKDDIYNGLNSNDINFVLNQFPSRWYTVYPAVNYNTIDNNKQYFINISSFSRLRLIELDNISSSNLNDITLEDYLINIPSFSSFTSAVQKGSTKNIVTNDTRIQTSFLIGNILYVTHTTGTLFSNSIPIVRIYEIDVINRTLLRSHTIDGNSDGFYNYYPAAAADKFGNIGFVYCTSSENNYPSMVSGYYNNTSNEYNSVIAVNGTKPHVSSRYGDYSDISLDPVDFKTFWGLTEVSSGINSWEIHIAKFCPSCGIDIQDDCIGIDCNGNGICVDGVCECNFGFDLDDCSECLDNYYGSDCNECVFCNNGECFDGINGNGECLCDDGWIGTICSECDENYYGPTCQSCSVCNNGECSDGLQGNGECLCNNGWTGELCDIPNNSCQNGFEIDEMCICQCGWTGELCSECSDGYFTNKCVPCSICQNGQCNESECICDTGWTGTLCDTVLNLCSAPDGYCCSDEQCPRSYCKNYQSPYPNGYWVCQ